MNFRHQLRQTTKTVKNGRNTCVEVKMIIEKLQYEDTEAEGIKYIIIRYEQNAAILH